MVASIFCPSCQMIGTYLREGRGRRGMNREHIEVLKDSSQLLHVTASAGGVVAREVIEVYTGTWSAMAMEYLTVEGSRLAAAGFQLIVRPSMAERWTRYEFRRVNQR